MFYQVLAEHLETSLQGAARDDHGLPRFRASHAPDMLLSELGRGCLEYFPSV